MAESQTTDIIDRIKDLHHQATTERSDYYVASTLDACALEITRLRATLLRIVVGCDELQSGGATKSGSWAAEIAKDALLHG